jgi:hypothetical protein
MMQGRAITVVVFERTRWWLIIKWSKGIKFIQIEKVQTTGKAHGFKQITLWRKWMNWWIWVKNLIRSIHWRWNEIKLCFKIRCWLTSKEIASQVRNIKTQLRFLSKLLNLNTAWDAVMLNNKKSYRWKSCRIISSSKNNKSKIKTHKKHKNQALGPWLRIIKLWIIKDTKQYKEYQANWIINPHLWQMESISKPMLMEAFSGKYHQEEVKLPL